ncbi:50S ribosomal protein L3 [Candidatus Peregrinibacteria bacterium RIFOXYA2_FULL_33_7]|nr:MAG: 50S ribosomal protein L3 [Candidatus Peregrinibacteria bacterium RIFOXYA2_FULL_33_7]
MPGIIGKKLGMTQIIQEDGTATAVTIISCEPNTIAQIKTIEKDGYSALVLGYQPLKKPTKNKKFKFLKEFLVGDKDKFEKGQPLTLEILNDIKTVTVTSVSKGKGFQGVMKRHNFHGGPASHGSHFKREPGSIGARAKPGRVHKGKKMAGRMGCDTITLKEKPIIYRNLDKNIIGIKGPVPGGKNNLVIIKTEL